MRARSVVAAAIDAETGEFSRRTMTPDYGGTLAWVGSLPCPVRVVYEAARPRLTAAGIDFLHRHLPPIA